MCRPRFFRLGSTPPSTSNQGIGEVTRSFNSKPPKPLAHRNDALIPFPSHASSSSDPLVIRVFLPMCSPPKERVREVFVSMDTDNDGHVSVEELRVGLQRCGISGGHESADLYGSFRYVQYCSMFQKHPPRDPSTFSEGVWGGCQEGLSAF